MESDNHQESGNGDEWLLNVRDLSAQFTTRHGVVNTLNNVSLQLRRGGAMGLVGESGCGKSTLALALMRLLAANGKITSGQIMFNGKELLTEEPDKMRRIRGKEIGMVFQDPLSSLTPTRTIGNHLIETLLAHEDIDQGTAEIRSKRLLERVGIPVTRFSEYPHQFSGGMRQRVAIAAALVCNPRLILLDEPTSALDRTVQVQIVQLLRDLQSRHGLCFMFVSHDLRVMRALAHYVMVMRSGVIVEHGAADDLFAAPRTDYTRALVAAAFDDKGH